jgi:membrane protein DedA with SNARE-associated domain
MQHSAEPLYLAGAIFLLTFVLEDLALAAGAFLLVENLLPIDAIGAALMIGIFLGDMMLYATGWCAQRWRWFSKIMHSPTAHKIEDTLHKNMAGAILLARCIPGARLPTYTAMGYYRQPLPQFFIFTLLASAVWCTAFLASTHAINTATMEMQEYRIGLIILLVIIFIAVPRGLKYWKKKSV